MKVSPEEIKKIAALARISLAQPEINRFQTEVEEVINYNVNRLKPGQANLKLDTTINLGQADDPSPSLPVDLALSNAPAKERGLIVVPRMLE